MSDPTPETLPVPATGKSYMQALESNGLLEGEPGSRTMTADVESAIHALHVVLAGGTVSIDIRAEGASSVVEELDGLLQRVLEDLNTYPPGFEVYF